ncbi:MAG TPA: hypothetical protein H9948_06650 [Candidatus Jeotgalibaca merdavium]|uniref:Uncharacterized protein n=2 Tax=Jeotgalibaca TaxID=1470540 RepID=A0A6G7K965_9LACT|nr:hypothetical protein [Jeotgalibaca arthritidis]QII81803.1 hypothetical protein G7057_04470 [Jeotgalibaca arthritidis]HJA90454.1 hypothetical protein [Candidatus Jeotgalibaca merdavium]
MNDKKNLILSWEEGILKVIIFILILLSKNTFPTNNNFLITIIGILIYTICWLLIYSIKKQYHN